MVNNYEIFYNLKPLSKISLLLYKIYLADIPFDIIIKIKRKWDPPATASTDFE